MRVRYQMYKSGFPLAIECKCDMTNKQAEKFYKDLSENVRCGWAEMVGEDDDNYMDVIKSFYHEKTAVFLTQMFG